MLTKDEARELVKGSLEHKGPWFKFRLCMLYALIDKKVENAAESGKAFLVYDMDDIPAKKYFQVMRMYYENLGFFVAYRTGNNRSKFVVSWDYDRFSESDKREIRFGYQYRTFDDPDVRVPEEEHKKKKKNKGSAMTILWPRSVVWLL